MSDSWNGIIWEGVYNSWADASNLASNSGFNSDKWLNVSKSKLLEFRKKTARSTCVSPTSNRSCNLPKVFSTARSFDKNFKTILDFGGGLGTHYELMRHCLKDEIDIDYHVVETENNVEEAVKLWENRIKFHSEINSSIKPDLCYSNSVLQYVEDWKGTIKSLIDLGPKLILLDDFPGGDIQQFVSIQNYYSHKMPCWFFNLPNAIKDIEDMGYDLVSKTRYYGPVLGSFSNWPMHNFHVSNRIEHSASLLFKARNE